MREGARDGSALGEMQMERGVRSQRKNLRHDVHCVVVGCASGEAVVTTPRQVAED
jgi:hypothetical protein